jgi:S1-C subfamily serine protease
MSTRLAVLAVVLFACTPGCVHFGDRKAATREALKAYQDELYTCTTPVVVEGDTGEQWRGTGFLYVHPDRTLWLVSNAHVFFGSGSAPKKVSFYIRRRSDKGIGSYKYTADLTKSLDKSSRIHPEHDLAAINVSGALAEIKDRYVNWVAHAGNILGRDGGLVFGDEVMVIGYPLGKFNDGLPEPILKHGVVSSYFGHPQLLEPLGMEGFLIDADTYPGMSGGVVLWKGRSGSPGPLMLVGIHTLSLIGIDSQTGPPKVAKYVRGALYADLLPGLIDNGITFGQATGLLQKLREASKAKQEAQRQAEETIDHK